MTSTLTDSATIEGDLSDLRLVIGYMVFDREALERELTAIKKRL